MSKYKDYLKSIGAPAAHIAALEKAEADDKSELDLTPLVDEYKTTQRKLMENDPDLVKSIAGKEKGKFMDMAERTIKKAFGLDSALIKDKDFDEIVAIAKSEGSKAVGKDLQTLQEENLTLNNRVKELTEVEIPKIEKTAKDHIKKFNINNKLQKKLPVADLRVPVETVDLVLNAKLAELYDLDLDDKGEVVIFGKGTTMQATNSDKTKLLTLDDVVSDILKTNKFIKESNADDIDPATGKKKEVQPAGDKKKPEFKDLPLGVRKAKEHEAKLKETQAAATGTQKQ